MHNHQNKAHQLHPNKPLQFGPETITPALAGTLLGTMHGNRPIRKKVVERYAREMLGGRWRLNGEAIKVSRAGRLVDGQHRLQAIIMANIAVTIHVLRGVDDEDMVTLDTGVGRTFFDATEIQGGGVHRMAGPLARLWYAYEQGSPSVSYTPSHQEIANILERHPSIVESAAFVNRLSVVRTRCRAAVQGFVHSYGTELWDRDTADLFMHSLNDGTALKADDPIYVLRRRLVDSSEKHRPNGVYVLAITIKAWNLWVAGKPTKSITWRSGGEVQEPYPRFSRDLTPVSQSPERMAVLKQTRLKNLSKAPNNTKSKAGR